MVDPSGGLAWAPLADAAWYEVVRGDLTTLRTSNGDFAVATVECVEDNLTAPTLSLADVPSVGEGFWYLVRGVNCKGKGTYDSGGPSQSGLRDIEIDSSGGDCG